MLKLFKKHVTYWCYIDDVHSCHIYFLRFNRKKNRKQIGDLPTDQSVLNRFLRMYLSVKTYTMFHSIREICIIFIWKMAYNFESNYNYTTKIWQVCSGVIFVQIVWISCNFVRWFVCKFGIWILEVNAMKCTILPIFMFSFSFWKVISSAKKSSQ